MIDSTFLEEIRKVMVQEGIEVIFISGRDCYLNTSVRPRDQILCLLLGFQGSSGSILVTQSAVFLLTDARYAEGAKRSLPNFVTVVDQGKQPLSDLLKEVCAAQARVAFDPFCVSYGFIQDFRTSCPAFTWQPWPQVIRQHIAAVKNNAQNGAFEEKMPFYALPDAAQVFSERHLSSASSLAKNEVFFLNDCASLSWLLGLRWHGVPYTPMIQGYGLLAPGAVYVWCDLKCVTSKVKESFSPTVVFLELDSIEHTLGKLVQGKKVKIDLGKTPYALGVILYEKASNCAVSMNPLCAPQAVKSPATLSALKKAQLSEAQVWLRLWYALEKSFLDGQRWSEWDVCCFLEKEREKNPTYQGPSFRTIAGFGANSALIHYGPNPDQSSVLGVDGVLLLDAGGQYKPAATTDTTRCFYIGARPSSDLKKSYTLLLKSLCAYSSAVFPEGTRGVHLEAVARRFLWADGKNYPHATGHGVGSFLSVHEPPTLGPRDDGMVLNPGMVVTCEPGYYQPGRFGLRLEDMLVVQKEKRFPGFLTFRSETYIPFDLTLVDRAFLTEEELGWLQSYHQRIMNDVVPFLDDEDLKKWVCLKMVFDQEGRENE